MDNIKFRLIENGKIVGYEEHVKFSGKILIIRNDSNINCQGVSDIYIPHDLKEQFTGLKDKNDKEIDWWEGDILCSQDNEITIIEYNIKGGGFYLRRPQDDKQYYWLPIYKARDRKWKKVGNIHENPELLQEAKP